MSEITLTLSQSAIPVNSGCCPPPSLLLCILTFIIYWMPKFVGCNAMFAVKLKSHQSKLFHSYLPAWSVAQLVERLSCKQKTQVQVPAAPILFEQGGLATPCNPATWMLRSRSRRMFELLTVFVPKRYTS